MPRHASIYAFPFAIVGSLKVRIHSPRRQHVTHSMCTRIGILIRETLGSVFCGQIVKLHI